MQADRLSPEISLRISLPGAGGKQVSGPEWHGWEEVTSVRRLDSMSGSFTFSLSDRWAYGQSRRPLAPGLFCQLLCDAQPVHDGFLDDKAAPQSAESHSMTVSGRDRSADLVDCSAVQSPGEWRGLNALQLAKILAGPFSVPVSMAGEPGPVFEVFKLEVGESAFEAIDRICKQRSLFATPDGKGGVRLSALGSLRSNTALTPENIKQFNPVTSFRERFSQYIVLGQRKGDDMDYGPVVAQVRGEALDKGVPRHRPLVIRAENQVNPASAQERAEWECRVRAAASFTLSVTVPGWHDYGGQLWQPNMLVPVNIPAEGIDKEMLIFSVTSTKNAQGSQSVLELKDPASYERKPVQKAAAVAAGTQNALLRDASTTETPVDKAESDYLQALQANAQTLPIMFGGSS